MEIYADILFLMNLVGIYAMLDITGRLTKCRVKRRRILAASAAGAVMAVLGFCFEDFSGLFKILSAALSVIISFGYHGRGSIIRIAVFTVMSYAVSGIFSVLYGMGGARDIVVRGGVLYFDMPIFTFALLFAAVYVITLMTAEFAARKKSKKTYSLVIILNGKSVRINALCDSGNVLAEPITGKAVVIAEWDKIKPLFDNISAEELKAAPEKYKLWAVPYHSLGNTEGIVSAFLADDIIVTDEKRSAGRIFVGIAEERLSSKGEYCALIGADV